MAYDPRIEALRRHAFVFNREVRMSDLGDISPGKLDAYDSENYHLEDGYYISNKHPRLVLADIDKITEQTIMAAVALEKVLAIRMASGGRKMSAYITANHTWALLGWVEAAMRGEIAREGNFLIHIDDHPDLQGMRQNHSREPLTMDNVGDIYSRNIMVGGDPAGIASFIMPAAASGFVGRMAWVYGEKPTRAAIGKYEDAQRVAREWERDPAGVRNDPFLIRELLEKATPHNEKPRYYFSAAVESRMPARLEGYRADEVVSELRSMGGPSAAPRGRGILDIDIDVADGTEDMMAAVLPTYKMVSNSIGTVTIAISPHFGAQENHIDKTMALIAMLKEWRRSSLRP